MSSVIGFFKRQFLPLGLLTVAFVGILRPEPGMFMVRLPTQYVAVSIIFVCSGLMLRTDEMHAAFSAWRATAWGGLSILLLTPVIGATLAFQAPVEASFQLGLALFCCMPTTLTSGVALTSQARGNTALALLLTVLTNTVGIFTVPFVLAHLLDAIGQVELSSADLLLKLCLTILLPLSIGRYLRRFLADRVDRSRSRISTISNVALISIPWMKFSESSTRLAEVNAASLAILVVSGLVIHGFYLLLNYGATRSMRLATPERKAVVLLASQKTLPVAMTVLALIPDSAIAPEMKGLMAIPCITFHLGQIFVDAIIATRWSRVG